MENNTYSNDLLEESKKPIPVEKLQPSDSTLKCDFCEKEIISNESRYIVKQPFRLRACKTCFRMIAFVTAETSGNHHLSYEMMKNLFPNAKEIPNNKGE